MTNDQNDQTNQGPLQKDTVPSDDVDRALKTLADDGNPNVGEED